MEIFKKVSSKNDGVEKTGGMRQLIGAKVADIKDGFQLQNKEILRELNAQSDSLLKQEKLLVEQNEKINLYKELIEELKEKMEEEQKLLEDYGKKISAQEEILGKFDMQASMFELQGSKMESILSNFPKLEGNVVSKINEKLDERTADYFFKLDNLEKEIKKNRFYVNVIGFFTVAVQVSCMVYILYYFMNR